MGAEDLGLLIVSGERGDLKHSAHGVYVYNDEGQREIDLTPDRFMGGAGQRRAELEEIYDAVVFGKPLWHDGRWGMATLEVVLAIIESATRHARRSCCPSEGASRRLRRGLHALARHSHKRRRSKAFTLLYFAVRKIATSAQSLPSRLCGTGPTRRCLLS